MKASDLRILICDESRAQRRLVKQLVMDIGAGEVAESPIIFGHTAPVATFRPNLIIGRLTREDKGMLEMLRWLRDPELTPLPGVPVLLTVGVASQELLIMAIKAGADLLVAEPLSLGALEKRITALVSDPPPRISTKTYYGPDRRRTPQTAYGGAERRGSRRKAQTAA